MNAVMYWNSVLLETTRRDYTTGHQRTDANGMVGATLGGPTLTSWGMAIVSIAIHDAVCAVRNPGAAYLTKHYGYAVSAAGAAALDLIVAGAAYRALSCLYPEKIDYLDEALGGAIDLPAGRTTVDFQAGAAIGLEIYNRRKGDLAAAPTHMPAPAGTPGRHQLDPFHPGQGYLGAHWGATPHFSHPPAPAQAPTPLSPPPALGTPAYAAAEQEVKDLGLRGSANRTPDQTEIGVFWGYDGPSELGVPPRLYNQIVRQLVLAKGLTLEKTAELFAVVNVAMADAGIDAWYWKYACDLWRPVVAFNPTGAPAGWVPLGAPQTNRPAPDGLVPATPNFPAYPSGHATFGAATFQALRLCLFPAKTPLSVAEVLGADGGGPSVPDEAFDFISEEFNGLSRDPLTGFAARPRKPRSFNSFAHAVHENAISRVYLGVHWRFDGLPTSAVDNVGGVPLGLAIGKKAHAAFAAAPSL
jgi:hypothetical protein